MARSLSDDDTLIASDAGDSERTLAGDEHAPAGQVSRGDPERIGHYLVLRRLGAGGMGVVYAAYDEQLDRKVALKLLLTHARDEPRLVREAQALARLSDPNVVQVYEIGMHGGQAFIAMEHLEGETLDLWLARSPRRRAEILRVFLDAGRGLAAAHAKDLIHRDFKPTNVMIRRDGRVCVMDFGLARDTLHKTKTEVETKAGTATEVEVERGGEASEGSALRHDLTATGAMMGTPAYMAPEQFAGAETGPATDQFCFCVALWEALHGERPFAGGNIGALARAVGEGELRPPRNKSVPRWLNEVVARGLAAEPAARHPSMLALLEALRSDPTRRRRILGVGLLVLVLVALALTWNTRLSAREHAARAKVCEGEAAGLTEPWSDARRAEAVAAQASLGRDHIDDSMTRASAALDAYASEWSALRRTTCLERELRLASAGAAEEDDPRAALADTRVDACFAERRDALAALVETWLVPDERSASAAVSEVASLPPIDQCNDERWLVLRAASPSEPDTRARHDALGAELQAIRELRAHDPGAALARIEEASEVARVLGFGPSLARAQLLAGDMYRTAGQYSEARAAFESAFEAAARSGDDLTVLEALTALSSLLGDELLEPKQALRWARLAEIFIDRLELGLSLQAAALQRVIGTAHSSIDDKDAALVALSRALTIFSTQAGPESLAVADTLNKLGVLEKNRRQFVSAERLHRRALAIRELQLGPTHPSVADSLFNIGVLYQHQGRHDEALGPHQRALALTIAARGPNHPRVGQLHQTIGVIYTQQGKLQQARDAHARALACHLNGFDPAHPRVIHNLGALASAELELGNIETAREHIDRALADFDPERTRSWQLSLVHMTAANIYMAAGARARAIELAHTALGHSRDSEMDDHAAAIVAWLTEHDAPLPTEESG